METPQITNELEIKLSLDDIVNMQYQDHKTELEKELNELQTEYTNIQKNMRNLMIDSEKLLINNLTELYLKKPDIENVLKFFKKLNIDVTLKFGIETNLFEDSNKYTATLTLIVKKDTDVLLKTFEIKGSNAVKINAFKYKSLNENLTKIIKEINDLKNIINNPEATKNKVRAEFTKNYLKTYKLNSNGLKLGITENKK